MENQNEHNRPGGGYEKRDLNVRVITGVGVAALLLFIFTLIILDQVFNASREKLVEDVVLDPVSVPLRELRDHEDEVLNSYKIIDTQKGTCQIPIERAMEILANQNFDQKQELTGNRKAP